MIIDEKYLVGTLLIGNLEADNPDADLLPGQAAEVRRAIAKYEPEFLIKCLGFPLYNAFWANFDTSPIGQSALKEGTDQKWDDLLNGVVYEREGVQVKYQGLISTLNVDAENSYRQSPIANYVYCKYLEEDDARHTGVGFVRERLKNANRISPARNITEAFNEMVELVEGPLPEGLISLSQFIAEANVTDPTTYPDYSPEVMEFTNRFGI